MSQVTNIILFDEKNIRSVWDDQEEEWFFSVVDVVGALTDSANSTDYLKKIRKRDELLGEYIGTHCPQVAMKTATGKLRKTLAANTQQIFQIIDSTHPHAVEITAVAQQAAKETQVNYVSKVRPLNQNVAYKNAFSFSSYDDILRFLIDNKYQTMMFAIGGNNIHYFKSLASKSYARVLPFEKSIQVCVDAGFEYSRIIGMQGPFSTALNRAFIEELQIDCLITKNSGDGSGFQEKVDACIETGIDLVIYSPHMK